MTRQKNEHRILVIGAGYAGMIAALRAAGRTRRYGGHVMLVNLSDRFVERIRLHQLAAGQQLRELSIPHMLRGTGVEFVEGRVTALEPSRREVHVDTRAGIRSLAYDSLVYALGSGTDVHSVAGVADHAHALSSPATASALYEAMQAMGPGGGRLLVCGGGLTGIEAATELAETFWGAHVSLVTREGFGNGFSPRGQAYLVKTFARRGIEVIDRALIRAIRAQDVEVEGRPSIPFDICLWAGSFSVPPLAREAGLEVNGRGQAVVDPFLRSRSHPEILVAGDAAIPAIAPGAPIRMACATAMPMGAQAADTIAAGLRGEEPRPFRFAYAGLGVSLGREAALGQPLHGDDTPRDFILTSRRGAWLKEAFGRYTVFALAMERRWPGSYRWPHGKSVQAAEQPGRATPVASA